MTRHRLLMVAGGETATPIGPPPGDPNLNTTRGVSELLGIGQNFVTSEGYTTRLQHRIDTDVSSLILAYGCYVQGTIEQPYNAKVTLELPSGDLIPVTFGGEAMVTLANESSAESDPIDVSLGEGDHIFLRTWTPVGQVTASAAGGLSASDMAGDHTTGPWVPRNDVSVKPGTGPVAILGTTRSSALCPAMIGDSIAGQGIDPSGWWRVALGTSAGLSYGRNARNFTGLDGREGETLRGATHILVQYGANDFRNSTSSDITSAWQQARDCYAYIDAQNPGIPIYQTTCTPLVTTTDNCATLANQTTVSVGRVAWNAFLRDGAPIDATTKAALAPGATGSVLRMGETGHPLSGFVDVAATVEEGGASAPTGKWLPGDPPNQQGGFGWGGDGVHPSIEGQAQMAGALTAWLSTLT